TIIVTRLSSTSSSSYFHNPTSTTETYTLSLHDALPICAAAKEDRRHGARAAALAHRCHLAVERGRKALLIDRPVPDVAVEVAIRSEEHTSELQSRENLVCRLLLEKKKRIILLIS